MENVDSSLQVTDDAMETQHDGIGPEDANDVPMDDGEEMIDTESESSDDEYGPESTSDGETYDLNNILLGLNESRLRYKVWVLNWSLSCINTLNNHSSWHQTIL